MNKVAEAPPNRHLMFSLMHAVRALEGRLEEGFGAVELSAARYGVLDQLIRSGEPLALSELAARLSCVRSNMTQLVDRLESEALVRRVADPHDRRSVRAEITPAGRERQAAGTEQLRRVQAEFDSRLTVQDRAALERVIATLR